MIKQLSAEFDRRYPYAPAFREQKQELAPVFSEQFEVQIRADYTHMRPVDMQKKYGTTKKQMEVWIKSAFRGRP